jgi:hypothetical protein
MSDRARCQWPVAAEPGQECGKPTGTRVVLFRDATRTDWEVINVCAEHRSDAEWRNVEVLREP